MLLFSQGCARMHFSGEGRDTKEKLPRAERPKGPLDELPRIDHQGKVSVEITFAGVTYREDVAFHVKIGTHAVKPSEYALDEMSTLANDLGTKVQASKWEITFMSAAGTSIGGTIYFPSKDASGKPLIAQEVRNLTLKIEDLAGIPERVFQWNVSPGHGREEKRRRLPGAAAD